MLILSGKQYLEKYFKKNDLEDNVCFAVSDSDYSNNEIGVQWLKHFNKCTWKNRKAVWMMLMMDGTSCHTNEKFMQICYIKNILPFWLLPHTTHLLQLLDVVCFQPSKHYHPEAINKAVCNGNYKFSKIEFLAQITNICLQAFRKNTIQESFRKTELIPFDLKIVMQKLQDLSSSSNKLDLSPAFLTPSQFTWEMFFTTSTTIHASALTVKRSTL